MTTEIENLVKFDRIRYAQCWEDADVLLRAIDVKPAGTYLSIAAAGDNALALVGAGAARVIAVDINPAQIALLELRVAAYRALDHGELLCLLGINPSRDREQLYRRCRSFLSHGTCAYWDRHRSVIRRGVAHSGRFERYLSAFRRLVLPLVHRRKVIERWFTLDSVDERRAFYARVWNNRRWRLLFRAFFAQASLGTFGRDPSFTRFADEPVWQALQRRIPVALIEQRPSDNPYLQWILKGRYETALPYALRAENFERIRNNLDALEWRCEPLEAVIQRMPPGSVDGANLSDIFEYMSRSAYEALMRNLVRISTPGCRLVYWNLVTERACPPKLRNRIKPHKQTAKALHAEDHAFFYRDLIVEEVLA